MLRLGLECRLKQVVLRFSKGVAPSNSAFDEVRRAAADLNMRQYATYEGIRIEHSSYHSIAYWSAILVASKQASGQGVNRFVSDQLIANGKHIDKRAKVDMRYHGNEVTANEARGLISLIERHDALMFRFVGEE